MYRLRTPPEEVARTLLILMRQGSFRAAEEITDHKAETLRRWLYRAVRQAGAITEVLVKGLHLMKAECRYLLVLCQKTRRCPTGCGRIRSCGSGSKDFLMGCVIVHEPLPWTKVWPIMYGHEGISDLQTSSLP